MDAPAGTPSGPTDVVVIDPRAVLEGRAGEARSVKLRVPAALLPALSKGINKLGDMDDPMDEYYFGKAAEIFEYRLVGVSSTQSGFTSIVTAEALERARASGGGGGASGGGGGGGGGEGAPPLPDWESFRQDLLSGAARFPSRRHPFLFAGHMLESAEAAVYELKEGDETVGLLVSSEAA
ncbi:hypothetical protein Rsub_04388 [Raphidocelis subcapitata]|uniref:Uncharacterized protein n=1 Tax=Raphidocelis subcapitata TaxID=307507 RepID=A0A2V0NWN9_9CHLO|nr:hypothetical protein Rsub_04388 [Raphidocelis subcapitata]|eukprot:GBF92041.1 hypothetical protein Rsub_04388 [Raphidocelis subcapitata]